MTAILAIAGADAAERMRRFAFMVTIAAALYAGYLYVPAAGAPYHTVLIHLHPGAYNSAFYGAATAALLGGFLTLFGFLLVRGSVERDAECHVDGIVGASPIRKFTFMLGKWLSNCSVLWAVALVAYIAAAATQIYRGHDLRIDVMAYVLPYLFITIPAMGVVSAIAIVFDVIPVIRGVLGAVLFIMFVWPTLLAAPMGNRGTTVQAFDPAGFTVLSSSLIAAERQMFPGRDHEDDVSFGIMMDKHVGEPFVFPGFHWTFAIFAQRLLWVAIAIALVAVASFVFDRFRRENVRTRNRFFVDASRLIPNLPFLRILRAEFGLIASGASIWWYLGAIGVIVAGALVPLEAVTKIVLPLACIYPLERISALGARERRYGVQEVVSATAGFATKTLAFQWLAGTFVTLLLCSSCVVRLLVAGDATSIVAACAVAAAMSALALGLGTTFGASRIFEALFVILWYLGPIQHAPGLDFTTGIASAPTTTAIVCAALVLAGLAATVVRRTVR